MGEIERTLTAHDDIRRWADQRDGRPGLIRRAAADPPLRIVFPQDAADAQAEVVPWEEFFRCFEERRLAMLVQDERALGRSTRFYRFIDREAA